VERSGKPDRVGVRKTLVGEDHDNVEATRLAGPEAQRLAGADGIGVQVVRGSNASTSR
jgi:hypothetical protein